MARSTTKTESKVAAREQLDQQDRENNTREQLEEQAKQQETQQKNELKAGAKVKTGVRQQLVEEGNVAGARRPSGVRTGAQAGFTDQLTRVNGNDPMEGNFVVIDRQANGVLDGYKSAGLVDDQGNVNANVGDYGVYLAPAEQNAETGYPETIQVRLQDATFTTVTVPYAACRHTTSRGL